MLNTVPFEGEIISEKTGHYTNKQGYNVPYKYVPLQSIFLYMDTSKGKRFQQDWVNKC